ncbi:hypothetical protein KEM55_003887, partial [Ascosphaera atra]
SAGRDDTRTAADLVASSHSRRVHHHHQFLPLMLIRLLRPMGTMVQHLLRKLCSNRHHDIIILQRPIHTLRRRAVSRTMSMSRRSPHLPTRERICRLDKVNLIIGHVQVCI